MHIKPLAKCLPLCEFSHERVSVMGQGNAVTLLVGVLEEARRCPHKGLWQDASSNTDRSRVMNTHTRAQSTRDMGWADKAGGAWALEADRPGFET